MTDHSGWPWVRAAIIAIVAGLFIDAGIRGWDHAMTVAGKCCAIIGVILVLLALILATIMGMQDEETDQF